MPPLISLATNLFWLPTVDSKFKVTHTDCFSVDLKFKVTHTDCFSVDLKFKVTHTDCSKVRDLNFE